MQMLQIRKLTRVIGAVAKINYKPTQQNFLREPVKTERSGVFAGGSQEIF